MRRTDFYIREDQHIALKALAEKETTTLSFILRRIIDEASLKDGELIRLENKPVKKIISNPIVARAVELAKEKDIKFTPVPKPERKKK